MNYRRSSAIGLLAATALAVPASADATPLQRQVDRVLEQSSPGGRQVAPNRITWPRAGVTMTLARPGTARAAALRDCPRGYACLWQDAGYTSRRVQFFHYRTYRLSAFGMPAGKRRGASSYFNNQTDGASAVLTFGVGANDRPLKLSMQGHSNLFGRFNDAARWITLKP